MSEHHDNKGRFRPGNRAGIRGRPRGIVEKRKRVTNALLKDAETIAKVVSAAAQGGDLGAASMIIDRVVPALKRDGSLVRFEFDPAMSLTAQFNALMTAIANGQLTVEEGQKLADMLRARAEIESLDGAGEKAQKLIDAFKLMAQSPMMNDGLPYQPPTPAAPAAAPTAPTAPVPAPAPAACPRAPSPLPAGYRVYPPPGQKE